MISFKAPALRDEKQRERVDAGGLDRDEVMYEYHTQEDARVRPSHAALEGTVWALGDPFAPVPPCDYGCRCWMAYVSKPQTTAALILPETKAEPKLIADIYAAHLDKQVPTWADMVDKTKELPRADRLVALANMIKIKYPQHAPDAKDLANMMLTASVPQKKENP